MNKAKVRNNLDLLPYLGFLNPREQKVMELRYLQKEPWKWGKIGKIFGVTGQTVKNIHNRAIIKIGRIYSSERCDLLEDSN